MPQPPTTGPPTQPTLEPCHEEGDIWVGGGDLVVVDDDEQNPISCQNFIPGFLLGYICTLCDICNSESNVFEDKTKRTHK